MAAARPPCSKRRCDWPCSRSVPRRVRFAFWSAEERGLLGSRHHVGALSEEARRHVALYINLDMVGSSNFIRFVQASAATSELTGIGSAKRTRGGLPRARPAVEERAGGRYGTDDASFYEKGIATVGLYTGAGTAKSQAQAALFGGAAGRPYDPCYHRACDTIENINREVYPEQNTHALMRALNAVANVGRGGSAPVRKTGDPPETRP